MKERYNIYNIFSTMRVIHNCDLLAVRDSEKRTYTMYKNQHGVEYGTEVSEHEFQAFKIYAINPIVLDSAYIDTDVESI